MYNEADVEAVQTCGPIDDLFPHLPREDESNVVDATPTEADFSLVPGGIALQPFRQQKHLPPLGWDEMAALADDWLLQHKLL